MDISESMRKEVLEKAEAYIKSEKNEAFIRHMCDNEQD